MIVHKLICKFLKGQPGSITLTTQQLSLTLLILFAVNAGQLLHFLQMLVNDFSLQRSHVSQELGWVSCPDFSFLDNLIVFNYSTCSNKSSLFDSRMLYSSAHSNKCPAMNGWSLDDGIRTDEYVISNWNISGDVNTILNDSIVADLNFFITNQSGSVPDRWLFTCWDVSDNGGVGCDEISLFKLRFVILKREIS